MTNVEPWNRIIEFWKLSQLEIRPGVPLADIDAFKSRHGVALPTDFLEYLRIVDGSSDGDMDNAYFRFWPLSEVTPVHEELNERDGVIYPDRFAYPDCFVFADYCINCWLYAIKLTSDPASSGSVYRVTANNNPGEKMANSFKEFMESYARNPDNIL